MDAAQITVPYFCALLCTGLTSASCSGDDPHAKAAARFDQAIETDYQNSAAQRKQLTDSSGDFAESREKEVGTITQTEAVPADNDPNGKLNAQGGCMAAIVFEDSEADQSGFSKTDLVQKGTAAVGSVEVYKTADDANARNACPAEFDGSLLDSGPIPFLALFIRTSPLLDQNQQQTIASQIEEALKN